MPDPTQLPHLLKLLDDDSETVQKSLTAAFAAFGPDLERELANLSDPPDEQILRQIRNLIHQEPRVLPEPRFSPGQLVCHRRYGYRGVVVDFDPTCQADKNWYQKNRTQPDRDQPWYHVLVHNSDTITYAAQTSLQEDESTEEIHHPYISVFFSDFKDGRYIRNDRPWQT